MWRDPEETVLTYTFFAGGTLEFGRARYGGGMCVGTAPLMARVRIPPESGGTGVPDGWFVLQGKASIVKLRAEFEGMGDAVFFPDWLRADLFEYHYRRLIGGESDSL
ncbi:MAG: hypothetical protein FJY85_00745 [Deltaproteobacteria bacterium]|nr:hypothetical protein [Deltaproteobacteria bacterium]